MTISLYDVSVASFLQTVAAMGKVLDKGLVYLHEQGIDPDQIVEAQLIADMRPFRFQVHSLAYHSLGALQCARAGRFLPPEAMPEHNYAELQTFVAETHAALAKLVPEEVNALEGKDLVFQGSTLRTYTVEGFLLSFSLPNFYFHATTAYDILRMKGAPIGKRDYIGAPRLKG